MRCDNVDAPIRLEDPIDLVKEGEERLLLIAAAHAQHGYVLDNHLGTCFRHRTVFERPWELHHVVHHVDTWPGHTIHADPARHLVLTAADIQPLENCAIGRCY